MGIEIVPCPGDRGCVDIIDSRWPDSDPLHLTAADWQEWVDAIKAGKLDEVARAAGSLNRDHRHVVAWSIQLSVNAWRRVFGMGLACRCGRDALRACRR